MKINGKEINEKELPEMINMEEHGLAYIAYAIALYLGHYDKNFRFDEIDTEWKERVYPLAIEFYLTEEYRLNIYDEPFMECLNRFLNNKPFYK